MPSLEGSTGLHTHLELERLDDWYQGVRAEHIRRVYEEAGGNVLQTAQRLSCSRDMVYRLLKIQRRRI